ncbi:MAG: hypothetical protein PHP54_05460 [Clostridia bacterium]|nr:hypothetical protein [Clostridia bacterium]
MDKQNKSNVQLFQEMEKHKESTSDITVTDIDEMTRNTSDENMTMLLKYYEEKTGKDFFADANKKIGVEEEIADAERAESDVKIEGEELEVDSQTTEKIKEEEEKKGEALTPNERLAIILKAQYLANLERYTQNVLIAQNAQIANNSFAMEDRINTRVILERKYGESRAVAYQNVTGESLLKDPEIKEAIEKCEKTLIAGNKTINQNAKRDIARVNELQEKINEFEDKIAELSTKALDMDEADFNIEMENLSKELNDARLELNGLTPDAADLERDLEIEEKNNQFEDKTLGYKSTVPHHELVANDAKAIHKKGSKKDDIVEEIKKDRLDDTQTDIHVTSETLDDSDKMIDEIENDEDARNVFAALSKIDNSISVAEFEEIKVQTGNDVSNNEIKADQEKLQDENGKEFKEEVSGLNQESRIVLAKSILREHVDRLRKGVKQMEAKEQQMQKADEAR